MAWQEPRTFRVVVVLVVVVLVVVVLVVVVVLTVPIAAVSWYLLVAPRVGSAQPRRAGWGFR